MAMRALLQQRRRISNVQAATTTADLPATPSPTTATSGFSVETRFLDGDEVVDADMRAELHSFASRVVNVLPFVVLLLLKLLYQHCVPLATLIGATTILFYLDGRFCSAIAPRAYTRLRGADGGTKRAMLAAIAPTALCVALLVDAVRTLSDGDDGLLTNSARLRGVKAAGEMFGAETPSDDATAEAGDLLGMLWRIAVFDLELRLVGTAVKAAMTALAAPFDGGGEPAPLPPTSDNSARHHHRDVESGTDASDTAAPLPNTPDVVVFSNNNAVVSEHEKARRRASLVEMFSSLTRTLLPSWQWARYYGEARCGKALVGVYCALKFLFAVRQLSAFVSAAQAYAGGHLLEYGDFATPQQIEALGCERDCSICVDTLARPVALPCTHIFCEACIAEWLAKDRTCPICRAEVASNSNVPLHFRDGATAILPQIF